MADPVQPQAVLSPVGAHTQNTSLSTDVAVTVPAYANAVLLMATTQNVRFTLDGTTPTATKGFLLKAGNEAQLFPVTPGQVLKFVEEQASAKLDYQFCKT